MADLPFPPVGFPFADGPGHIVHADYLNSIVQKILRDFEGVEGDPGPQGIGFIVLGPTGEPDVSVPNDTIVLRTYT